MVISQVSFARAQGVDNICKYIFFKESKSFLNIMLSYDVFFCKAWATINSWINNKP